MGDTGNPMDKMSEFLSSSLMDMGQSEDDQIRKFETIAIGVLLNMVIGSLPDEASNDLKNTIYDQWKDYVAADASKTSMVQAMFMNSLGGKPSDTQKDPINKNADAHVRRILFGDVVDKEE